MKMQTKISGNGNPLVLVPGGLTGWISWNPHAETLSQTRMVIQVQLLNVQLGLENKPLPADYSVGYESNALSKAIKDLNLGKPFDIAAWSFGALVTLDYALNNPDKVRSVVLIEPPPLWVLRSRGPFEAETEKTINNFRKHRGNITEDTLEEFLTSVGFVAPGQSVKDLPQWKAWLPFRQSLRNNPFVVEHNDDISKLSSFKKPVLLVKGTGSAKFLHQIIDILNENLLNSSITEMPAGHAPHIVSKDRFLMEMEEFQKD